MKTIFFIKFTVFIKLLSISSLTLILLVGCSDCERCGCNCDSTSFNLFGISRKIHGSGNVIQEKRLLEPFSAVVLSEEGDLFIEVGEQETLMIEAEDNLQEYLVAEIDAGILNIKKHPESIQLNAKNPIQYYLTVTNLEGLTLENSGDGKITEVNSDQFEIRISGSGSLNIDTLTANQLDIALTSSGNLIIRAGEVDTQNINLSSSGKYDGVNLISRQTNVRLSSSGNATVYVLENLEADLSSSGNVYFSGDPSIRIRDASSSGRVIKTP